MAKPLEFSVLPPIAAAHAAPPPPHTASDAALLSGLRARQPRAQARFVRDNMRWMKALARRYVKCEAIAEDIVQEAFFSAFRSIDRFEGRSSVKSWLFQVTKNAALMHLRKAKRVREIAIEDCPNGESLFDYIDLPSCATATPHDLLEAKERCTAVNSAVSNLPSDYQQIIQLRVFDEHDTEEVAQRLSLSASNVKVRLHRARGKLKTFLEHGGAEIAA